MSEKVQQGGVRMRRRTSSSSGSEPSDSLRFLTGPRLRAEGARAGGGA